MRFSKKIIDIRNKNNLTQEDLAEILSVSRQTISNWENDKCYPDIEMLNTISNQFDVSLDVMLKEDESVIKDISKRLKINKINKWVILALTISIFIMIGLGYKIYLVCYYNNNFSADIFDEFVDKGEKLIITNNNMANNKYENLNFYLSRRYYEDGRGIYKSHILYDTITITKIDNLYNSLNTNKVYLKNINYEKLFKKFNIENQVDLLKYINNNHNDKFNILTSKDKLEINFISEYFVVNEVNNKLPIIKYYYFENDIVGKLIYRNCDFLIEVYNNNETYVIKIESPYIHIEDALYILNSIYFD